MNEEILEVLKSIRGELVMLRNEFIMLRVAVEAIEEEVKKPKVERPQELNVEQMYGSSTVIEKL